MENHRKIVIGIMGPGSTATSSEMALARSAGSSAAIAGFIVLTGGSNLGVMNAALEGAKSYSSTSPTLAITSHDGDPGRTSIYADIVIPTGMGEGRNYLNIRSSDGVIVCCDKPWTSLGTMSEIMFALKQKIPIVFLRAQQGNQKFYNEIMENYPDNPIWIVRNPITAVRKIKDALKGLSPA